MLKKKEPGTMSAAPRREAMLGDMADANIYEIVAYSPSVITYIVLSGRTLAKPIAPAL